LEKKKLAMKKSAMVKVEIDINIPLIIVNVFGVQHVNVTLTQPWYEQLVHHLIEFITQPCKIVSRMPMS
jgi:nitrogen fixation/metabolism regulation signal transduction histidine kinase